jgi:hypothetical protein
MARARMSIRSALRSNTHVSTVKRSQAAARLYVMLRADPVKKA